MAAVALLLAMVLAGCAGGEAEPGVVRVGHFANLTHAQALYGFESGLFEERLQGIEVRQLVFNAGPTAYEALLGGSVDILYVGPAPTLNVLQAAGDDHLRIIAGAAEGGAFLILREGMHIESASDLDGRRFAAPQLGNTQDVALRHWILQQGHRTKDLGGRVDIVNTPNSDILAMMKRGRDIDGAWVPEPWASRILAEAPGAYVHIDEATLWPEGRFVTTHLVTTKAYLENHPDEVRRFVAAHVEATERLRALDEATNATINAGLASAGGVSLPSDVLTMALANIRFTTDPNVEALEGLLTQVQELGITHGKRPDLRSVVHEGPLAASRGDGGPA